VPRAVLDAAPSMTAVTGPIWTLTAAIASSATAPVDA
jgi:hypothetical protein